MDGGRLAQIIATEEEEKEVGVVVRVVARENDGLSACQVNTLTETLINHNTIIKH